MTPRTDATTDEPSDLAAKLRGHWERTLARANERIRGDQRPVEVVHELSGAIDQMIRWVVDEAQEAFKRRYPGAQEPFAICAAGGYGRRELYPKSDVDLLFLHAWKPTPLMEWVAESVLYTFWDLGFTIGHASRSAQECVQLGREDVTIRTNLLDLRFVAGDEELFATARDQVERELLYVRNRQFVEAKIREMRARRQRYGNTSYLLEPNIKESPGGLRDLQTIYWIGKTAFRTEDVDDLYRLGLLEQEETEQMATTTRTLMRMRTLMHLTSGKAQDRLTFGIQERIAPLFGYRDRANELASERFMRHVYELNRETVQAVDHACEVALDRLVTTSRTFWFRRKRALGDGFYRYRDQLHGTPQFLRQQPHLMLAAFRRAQQEDVPLSFELKKELKHHAHLLRDLDDEEAERAATLFHAIVTDTDGVFATLHEMNELGVLRSFMPEFDHQYCRIQHDTYHIYTADVHLLFCLRAYADLRGGRLPDEAEIAEVAQSLADPLVGAVAVLLHDIGKGYGTDHSVKGAELCEEIGPRLGLSAAQTRMVASLVRHHLLMSHIAQRRDLSDPKVIREFAETVGSTEMLDQLLVLTTCDQLGVGPGVWTPWKRTLLLKLHEDAKRVLEREDIQGIYRNRIRTRKARLRKELGGELDDDALARLLEEMPPRFFLRHSAEVARDVAAALEDAANHGVALRSFVVPEIGSYVLLCAPDRPGLFAFHAGLFRRFEMSIVDAEGYVLAPSGWVVNIFLVSPTDPLFFAQDDRVASFRQRMLAAMREAPDELRQIETPQATTPAARPRTRRRIRVRADQELSSHFTVFEVFGWDRIGLLQELALVFFRHGCTIGLARIHTEGQRVSDSFYVQTAAGEKLGDPEQIEAIRAELLEAAREPDASGDARV